MSFHDIFIFVNIAHCQMENLCDHTFFFYFASIINDVNQNIKYYLSLFLSLFNCKLTIKSQCIERRYKVVVFCDYIHIHANNSIYDVNTILNE